MKWNSLGTLCGARWPFTHCFELFGLHRARRNQHGYNSLTPLRVVDPDHRRLADRLVAQEDIFDLEGRHLLPAGLEDVDRGSAQDPVATLLDDRGVAGAEPSIGGEGRIGVLGSVPVFEKDGGSLHLDLAGLIAGDSRPVLAHEANLDTRKRHADRARDPLSAIRVGQTHPYLSHPVPLEQGVTGQLSPSLQDRDGQGRRAGDHEPQAANSLAERGVRLFGRSVRGGR